MADVSEIRVIGVGGIPLIKRDDDLGQLICDAAEKQGTPIVDRDVIVVTQKIVSKTEGRLVRLKDVTVSPFSRQAAQGLRKCPQLVEVILGEAKSIVRMVGGHLITETRDGWICANSGVDQSNVSGGDTVTLLPIDSDRSARRIRKRILEVTGRSVAVIITDTFGRPFRVGHVDVCIGVSGISPLLDLRGQPDLFGYVLRVKRAAIGDELASAAELVMGNNREQTPAAIIRGYNYAVDESAEASDIIMPWEKNLFL
jgi:coenzyme F420-0:L-glutamate ligase/coenzyme F420-1:gamma-L-glutamate ligase